MKDTPTLLQSARVRLRRVETRLQRYPQDQRLLRLRREACFRVTELEALLEEISALRGAPAAGRRARPHTPAAPSPCPRRSTANA